MKASDAKPGDRLRVGGPVSNLPPLVVTVVAGTPSEPHLIRTDWGDFADHVCEPTDEPPTRKARPS